MKRFINCTLFIMCISLSAQNDRETIDKIDKYSTNAYNYFNEDDYVKAYNYFNESLKSADALNDSYDIAMATLNLGNIYYHIQQYDEAEKLYLRSLTKAKLVQNNFLIANTYLSLGKLSNYTNKEERIIPYFKDALDYANKKTVRDNNNIDRSESTKFQIAINFASSYLKKEELNKAFSHLLKAKKSLENIPLDPFFYAQYSFVYGKYFEQKMSYKEATIKYKTAINILEDQTINNLAHSQLILSEIYKSLATSYFKLKENQNAYKALLKHSQIKDERVNVEKFRYENISKSKYYIADYKNAADVARKQLELQEQASNKTKLFSLATVIAIIALLILILSLYRNFNANLRLNKMLKLKNIELEHSKKEAEESSQLKTQFISNVTHELRTPLYGVVGLSALLLNSKDLSKKDYRYIKSIKYSADYLLELVNNVLQMGKMESETIALKSIPTNLSTMLKDIVSTFEKRLQETNNTLVTKVDKAIPNMLDFDKVRLTQILVNLIGNSIKFTENGTIHLRVKQLNSDDNKVKLNFEVEDNGTGISKKNQKRIFQNFTQLVDKNNNKYQGTGLGLPIAQNLVELFGGSIEVKSELGKGASFSFTIDVEKSNVIEQINHPHPQYLTLNGNYKVLVAEDNKINQIVTRNLLEEENFECHVVNNGAEALAEFKNNTFDLILMDINMPIMGGNEATTKIRAINPNIPIIALTAADIEEVEKDYQSIGYNDVITKPFDNHSFFQKVIERIQESKIKQNYEAFNKAKKLHISS